MPGISGQCSWCGVTSITEVCWPEPQRATLPSGSPALLHEDSGVAANLHSGSTGPQHKPRMAAGVGTKSAWIHHGRSWTASEFEPDLIASSIDEALDGISRFVTAA